MGHVNFAVNQELTKEARTYWSTFWGVTRLSVLHEVRYFDICKCIPHDIMHVLLEGIVPLEMKLFLHHAIDYMELFTINWLSEQIATMPLRGVEATDRPSPIDRAMLNSGGHKLNQYGENNHCHCHYYLHYYLHHHHHHSSSSCNFKPAPNS